MNLPNDPANETGLGIRVDKKSVVGLDCLEFSFLDEDIIESFGIFFEKVVDAMNGTLKPQASKVIEVGERELKNEFDEIKRMRQLIRSQDNRHEHNHDKLRRVQTLKRDGN